MSLGFYHFDHWKLIKPTIVRVALTWGQFEPREGHFDWNNKQARRIDELLENGYTVLPNVRCHSSWGVKQPSWEASSAPIDMDTSETVREGQSYSGSYYYFLEKVQGRWNFPLIVIENEINDPLPDGGDWGGSIDEYKRLLVTAKTATGALIADGGLQPRPLFWYMLKENLDHGRDAQEMYVDMMGKDANLSRALNAARKDVRVTKVDEIMQSDLYEWVDKINFHWLHSIDVIQDVVECLSSFHKPLMCNAYGSIDDNDIVERTELMRSMNIDPLILMTTLDNGRIKTALTNKRGGPDKKRIKVFNGLI